MRSLMFDWIIPPGAEELPGSAYAKPEAEIQIRIIRAIRSEVKEKNWPVLWFSVPNQLEISGKRAMMLYILRRMMGVVKGAPDIVIGINGRMLAMEVKAATKLSIDQKDFREWCSRCGVPYHMVTSAEQAISIIKSNLGIADDAKS